MRDTDEELPSNLTIRALPASVRRKLAERAMARHMSLNAYLVELLAELAATSTMAEWPADLDEVLDPTGSSGDDVTSCYAALSPRSSRVTPSSSPRPASPAPSN